MMTIQEQIKNDMVKAMKEKNVELRDFLRVVMAEFSREGKELPDERVIAILKKLSANAAELNNDSEVKMLNKYLPVMIGPNQIKVIVAGLMNQHGFSGIQDMGKVMQEIKKLSIASSIDGKLSSSIVRELLSKS
jgi:uncharacterized protein YqeY